LTLKESPGGVHIFVTDSWGTFDFAITNAGDTDRQARVVVFYEGRADVQYGRDVWVPAHSTLSTWMLVGPPPERNGSRSRELEILLYERIGGQDRLVLPPGQERIRTRGVLYRKREPFTVVLVDDEIDPGLTLGRIPPPPSPAEEAIDLTRTFRLAAQLSELVHSYPAGALPASPEALDGVDQIVLVSNQIERNPAGLRTLRHWLERGGKLWVMLDQARPEILVPLLGEAIDFQVVDHVPLTAFRLEGSSTGAVAVQEPLQNHERPVDLARVVLPAHERAPHTVNGWPAWFTRQVGRGRVVFTTLGPRAWHRPREAGARSPFPHFPATGVPSGPIVAVGEQLQPPPQEDAFRPEALWPLLEPEIGYAVASRVTVVLVFGSFLLAAVGVGLLLRRSRRPELVGWLGPAAALGAAGAFLVLGVVSRRGAPATAAVAQVVEAVPGTEEGAVHGLAAVYRPDSGPVELSAHRGGFFELDTLGLEGQTRRFMVTDRDAWRWDGVAVPTGVRRTDPGGRSLYFSGSTGEPITAMGRFGPDGLEGRLTAAPFRNVGDAVLSPRDGRDMAARLRSDGTFSVATHDSLPENEYITGGVLNDRQQRRQQFYRQALKRPPAGRPEGPTVLYAWADPLDMSFSLGPAARTVGHALLIVPLRLERAAPGERVTVPGPLVPCRRLIDGVASRVRDGNSAAELELRFQLPAVVLPLKVERARLVALIEAPGRRVTVNARADGGPVELYTIDSPLDPISVDIAEERYLRTNVDGGLRLDLSLGRAVGPDRTAWKVKYLELEVTGVCQ
jgi:hypothetical protein